MIVSPDLNGNIDQVWYSLLKNVNSSVPIVIVTKLENYKFNPALYELDKYILVCGCEYGWNFPLEKTGTHIWGQRFKHFDFGFHGEEWDKFDEFVGSRPPLIVFKREIMDGANPLNYYPINYPAWYELPPIQSREEFDSRKLLFNFIWGLSNERRKTIHGEIWQRAGEFGYVVCDNVANIGLFLEKEDNDKKVLTANVPWYARHPMDIIFGINQLSKISISVGGCGRHCFRDSESSMNSVMFRWEDGIKFSYPWVHNVNCIKSEPGKELETIMAALNNPNLYDIYVGGVENCQNYVLANYVKNYIEPIIKSKCE